MQTDEQLKELARKTAERVIALTTTLNEEIRTHIQSSSVINSDPGIGNHLWMETAYLGCHLMQKKFEVGMDIEERKKFIFYFKKEFMLTAVNSAFRLGELEKAGVEMMLEADYDDKLSKYGDYHGDTVLLFKNELKTSLLGQTGKLKAKQESLMAKIFSKSREDSVLPDNVLDSVAHGAVKLFEAATI